MICDVLACRRAAWLWLCDALKIQDLWDYTGFRLHKWVRWGLLREMHHSEEILYDNRSIGFDIFVLEGTLGFILDYGMV